MQIDWLDDTLFDKWMVDIASEEKLEEAKSDSDETHEDEIQIIDSLPPLPRKEEGKEGKSSQVKDTVDQLGDVVEIKLDVAVTLSAHDDMSGDARVEVNL